jgi:hypothetical protein
MPATYDKIATATANGSQSTITFSSIPATYTDLRLIISAKDSSGTTYGAASLIFNGDNTSNYSFTNLYGDGSTAGSSRGTSETSGNILINGGTASSFGITTVDIFNYANATTYKTFISRGNAVQSFINARVGLWRKTPEAMNSIAIVSTTYASGSTFTLYGIKAA